MKHTRSVISFGPNGYVIQHDDTPLLPGMGSPVFGGVTLKPGMGSRRPYTGPQPGLFAAAQGDGGQESLTETTKPLAGNHNETGMIHPLTP